MKSSEKFRDTQSVPFMVDKTRKTTFSPTGKKNFFLKKNSDPENVGWCRKNYQIRL